MVTNLGRRTCTPCETLGWRMRHKAKSTYSNVFIQTICVCQTYTHGHTHAHTLSRLLTPGCRMGRSNKHIPIYPKRSQLTSSIVISAFSAQRRSSLSVSVNGMCGRMRLLCVCVGERGCLLVGRGNGLQQCRHKDLAVSCSWIRGDAVGKRRPRLYECYAQQTPGGRHVRSAHPVMPTSAADAEDAPWSVKPFQITLCACACVCASYVERSVRMECSSHSSCKMTKLN